MIPFHKLLDVRSDVADGTLDHSAYAARLGDVVSNIDNPAAKEYRDPEMFKAMTYETDGMRKVLDDVRMRLQEGRGNGVRQIETSFGGGKTHAMIAMYHKCTEWGATPIVIDGQFLGEQDTLWGEMERQLDGAITKMTGRVAPPVEKIHKLLGERSKPILILIDEIFHHMVKATAIPIGNSDLAAQNIIFMQSLNGQLGSMPNVCLVMSLSDKDDVLDLEAGKTAKIQNEYYEKLRNIIGRHRQLVTISEYNDISHIIRRRLFNTEEGVISDRAKDIVQWCIDKMKEGGSISGDDVEEYAAQFSNTYPFTPDVIDVLYKRWGSYPTFQRTRGVLRMLSLVVHSMLKSKRSWIAPADIDLSVPEIRREMLQHTGDNAESMIGADIVGNNALARKADGDVGARCATSIFMYSFPSTVRGATLEEVKRSSFTNAVSHSVIGDGVGKLLRHCFYLNENDDKMVYFDINPNINHMIAQAKRNVSDAQMRDAEHKWLDGAIEGGMFKVHIWPDETHAYNIPDRAVLQLIICKKHDPEWCANVVNNANKSRRINMNCLIFLLPSDSIMLSDLLRQHIGAEETNSRLSGSPEYTAKMRAAVNAEIKNAKDSMGDEMCKKYCVAYIPKKGGGVNKIHDYMFNPRTDSNTSLDRLLWNRLVEEDHVAVEMAPDIAARYGSDADSAYDTMMRTPGNAMPASLEIVRRAFEAAEPDEDPDMPVFGQGSEGGSVWGSTTQAEPDEPEATYERMVYAQVVDAARMGTLRSLLLELDGLPLTAFECSMKLRPDGMFDIRLEMSGKIPDRIVSSIDSRYVETDGGWDD